VLLSLKYAPASGQAAPGGGANVDVGAAASGNAALVVVVVLSQKYAPASGKAAPGGGANVDVGTAASGNAAPGAAAMVER